MTAAACASCDHTPCLCLLRDINTQRIGKLDLLSRMTPEAIGTEMATDLIDQVASLTSSFDYWLDVALERLTWDKSRFARWLYSGWPDPDRAVQLLWEWQYHTEVRPTIDAYAAAREALKRSTPL